MEYMVSHDMKETFLGLRFLYREVREKCIPVELIICIKYPVSITLAVCDFRITCRIMDV